MKKWWKMRKNENLIVNNAKAIVAQVLECYINLT